MRGVLYNITLHAKRDVSSTCSYRDILAGIFYLGKIKNFVSFFKRTVFHGFTRKFTDQYFLFFRNFLLFFYVIEIKTTVFPIYPNFDFEIAKNASQPVLEIFDKYYLLQCLLSASEERIMGYLV